MLRYLRVRDLAVFDEATCDLGPGLNLLTGETGAGKSLLVDAIGLLLGDRARTDMIRTGRDAALVEGIFDITPGVGATLADLGQESEEQEELVIRRRIAAEGRSRAFLNDSPVTLDTLRRLAADLVEIHGQHAHQALLRPAVHRDWLDRTADLLELRRKVADLHRRLSEAEEKLLRLSGDAEERRRRLDLLQGQIADIEEVDPAPGEADALRSESALLANREGILQRGREALVLLQEEEDAAAFRAGRAAELLEEITEMGAREGFEPAADQAREAGVLLADAASTLASALDALEGDTGRLEEVEGRLARLEKLEKRHGGDLASVLDFLREAREERDLLLDSEAGTDGLEEEIEALRRDWARAAADLREERKRAAPALAARVEKELEALAMEGSRFVVGISPRTASGEGAGGVLVEDEEVRPAPHGADRIEFLISPNPGEEPRPLGKVASGGELSRVMLALRTCLPPDAAPEETVSLVFDEVDAGVSGTSGFAVGERLAEVARSHQVLCVTHLAQVAARGARHLAVEKEAAGGRTRVSVRAVTGPERVDEVARMLGGTEAARDHARRLLEAEAGDKARRGKKAQKAKATG